MRLLNCQIENFGCLSSLSLSFSEGLNLLYAPNGSGKSTFAVFLKAMLYGLPATRRADINENERKRYTPWQGGGYGGALEFETEGKKYRIERFFGAKERDDRLTVYDLATGNPVFHFGNEPGTVLFGVDADGFERSLYLSQRAPYLGPDNVTIRSRLGSLLESSEDLGCFEHADELLGKAMRRYQTKGSRGKIFDLAREIACKEEEIRTCENAAVLAEETAALVTALDEKKNATRFAMEEASEQRVLAEKRRRTEEQRKTHRDLLAAVENEKAILLPLEAFFANHLPTDEEIAMAEEALNTAEAFASKEEECLLPAADAAELASLKRRYGDTPPSADTVSAVRTLAEKWKEAEDEAEASMPRNDAEFVTLSRRFEAHTPIPEEEEEIRRAAEMFEEINAKLYETAHEKRKRPLLPMIISAVFALLFTSIGVAGFSFAVIPLGVAFSILALATTALFFFLLLGRPKGRAALLADLEKKRDVLCGMLIPYGYTEKNPTVSASYFFQDLERFRRLCAQRKEAFAVSNAAKERAEQHLHAFHRLVDPFYAGKGTPAKIAEDILYEVPLLVRLLASEKEMAEKKARYRAGHEESSAIYKTLLADFPSLASLGPREAVAELKKKLFLSRQSVTRYQESYEKLCHYLEETGFDPDVPPLPYLGEPELLMAKEQELNRQLLAISEERSAKEAQRERYSETAALLPIKKAEAEGLVQAKAEAEHTLSLLQATQKLLTDAKEDLSTRYLRDMELHFDRYYDGLYTEDEKKTDKFFFDTSLSLSTETHGERRSVDVLSRGERDLISLCARLSLVDAIFEKETPMLILDDPFVNLDDENYQRAMKMLSALGEKFQIFYTSCSESRLQTADGLLEGQVIRAFCP